MNLALLIGIEKYDRLPSLAACANDLVNMHELLKATNKYQEIKVLDVTSAEEVKKSLRDFFSKFSNSSKVNEVFVYFSGHGGYQNDALFCCSDFDNKRASTTSISNAELDDLLRSINPKVAVKVIDACQSGAPYIKDSVDGFVKSLGASRLSSFVCMSSSQHDQNSYATNTGSDFTNAWIESALSKQTGDILYRDIQAALADAFSSIPSQTPYFVNQGSGLETFSAVTEEMRELSAARIIDLSPLNNEKNIEEILKYEISKNDSNHVDHADAIAAVETSFDLLASKKISDTLVSKFYKKTILTSLKLVDLPQTKLFSAFGENQGWGKKYFIDIQHETYTAKISNPMNLLGYGDTGKAFTVERSRPYFILSTEALPIEAVVISLDSNNPSLPSYRTYIGLIHSHTEIMILSSTASLTQKGWNKTEIDTSEIKWEYQSASWKTVVASPSVLWERGLDAALNKIRENLEGIAKKASAD